MNYFTKLPKGLKMHSIDSSEFDLYLNEAQILLKKLGLEDNVEIDEIELADFIRDYHIAYNKILEENDKAIDYNDEIVSIEDVGELETMDITVSDDHLFYCNDILVKNSFGLPHTLDLFLGLITTEDLRKRGQFLIKQLKNRYNDPSYYNRFFIGVDYSKMRLYDLEESAAVPPELSGDDPINEEEEFIDRETQKIFDSSEEAMDFSDFNYE
jgi:hypothetical protein